MKLYKIIYIAAIVLLASSCKDSNKKQSTGETKIDNVAQPAASSSLDPAKGIIKFKVNGQQIATTAWNVSIGNSMTGVCIMNITSNMHEDARTISINVNACSVGIYQLSQGNGSITTKGIAYGSYRPDYLKKMMDAYRFESGSINIQSFNEKDLVLNASFSGKVKNEKGEELDITDGQVINAPVKTPPKGAIN